MTYYSVKVCMLGADDVGKTSLLLRFIDDKFDPQLLNTLGAGYRQKILLTKNGTRYQLEIWDTPGHKRYQATNTIYCRTARVGVIVLDVTKRESLNGAKQCIELFTEHCNSEDYVLVLVGNKVDLSGERVLQEKETRGFASENGAIYWETSALTGFNVEELFADICTQLEERGNKNLKVIVDPTAAKQRTLTVLTEAGELIEPNHTASARNCCS